MATTLCPYQDGWMLVVAQDVREFIPQEYLTHHVSDLVDGLDLTGFYERHEGGGRRNKPYEPRMMANVLFYGYATGAFSWRGIARKLEEDVALRMLTADSVPNYRMICEFRCQHLCSPCKLFQGACS